jgi:hypothetical protein
MHLYDENDYPRWCLVTSPERFRLVIDTERDAATLDVVVAEAALTPDGDCYKIFFRTKSLARWYRRKYRLTEYALMELDYGNWLRTTGGDPVYIVEGIADDNVVVSWALPE